MTSRPYIVIAAVAPLVYDTISFVGISWSLLLNSLLKPDDASWRTIFSASITGKYLPPYSRGFLRSCQLYFLVGLSTNLIILISFYAARNSPLELAFVPMNVAVTNIVNCNVFRKGKLARFRESELSTLAFSENSNSVAPSPAGRRRPAEEPATEMEIRRRDEQPAVETADGEAYQNTPE
ncbi:hypothetical protein HGRIS_006004 [Hohenbuehelia grisea]|uniref:GtrA-like protein domain-containing protein n=1 Tax=Hohenbuehelia grisea TaxID=104357 RepID=A0ABR3JZE8_9AGAR